MQGRGLAQGRETRIVLALTGMAREQAPAMLMQVIPELVPFREAEAVG